MSGQWKPGDVAMVTFKSTSDGTPFGGGGRDSLTPGTFMSVAVDAKYGEGGVIWQSSGGGVAHESRRDCIAEVRPLVVIDAEDREQVERLARGYVSAADAATPPYGVGDVDLDAVATAMQAALRNLIAPPKPEEPQGLGAVVEDADGAHWILVYSDETRCWAKVGEISILSRWREFDQIAAVRVLSGGVP